MARVAAAPEMTESDTRPMEAQQNDYRDEFGALKTVSVKPAENARL